MESAEVKGTLSLVGTPIGNLGDMSPRAVVSMGKDKTDAIKNAILEIYSHNDKCLIGYTKENIATYKAMPK